MIQKQPSTFVDTNHLSRVLKKMSHDARSVPCSIPSFITAPSEDQPAPSSQHDSSICTTNQMVAQVKSRESYRDCQGYTAYILYNLRVLHHAHALFVEPLLGAHISGTVVANAIKSKLL